jgi:dihydrofolate reductase
MQIRAHIGVSADGFVATPDGRPALLAVPGFVPGESHGHAEFVAQCDAVVMGRTSFEPALGAPAWPWPGKQVYVLTSRPLPAQAPADVIVSRGGPAGLLEQLRAARFAGDVHLLGGVQTIQAFRNLGAIDRYELQVLPILLGDGVPLFPPGAPRLPLRLDGHRSFPDGTVELAYVPA